MKEALFREHPELYDVFYGDIFFKGESEFVIERTFDGAKILIVGCGTGEHARILEEKGFDVTGVDKNREILELARTKSDAEFFQSSLPELEGVPGEYDVIWIPHQPIHYIEKEEVGPALERMKSLLTEDGKLVFDMFDFEEFGPDMEIYETENGDYARLVQVVHGDGDHIR